jgi:hypothetical protein
LLNVNSTSKQIAFTRERLIGMGYYPPDSEPNIITIAPIINNKLRSRPITVKITRHELS